MNSRVHPNYKTKYRVTNWSDYDRALVQRGNITLWISEDAVASWKLNVLSSCGTDDECVQRSVARRELNRGVPRDVYSPR